MAEAQCLKEVLKVLIVVMIGVLDMLKKVWVFKVYIRDTGWVLEGSRIIFTILIWTCREAFEFHYVLGKRASLVTEYVVDHAELFVKIRGLAYWFDTTLLINHHDINLNKVSLDKIDHFQSKEKRYRYEVH